MTFILILHSYSFSPDVTPKGKTDDENEISENYDKDNQIAENEDGEHIHF